MKKNRLKPFLVIVLLIAVTGATMAYSSGKGKTLLSNFSVNLVGAWINYSQMRQLEKGNSHALCSYLFRPGKPLFRFRCLTGQSLPVLVCCVFYIITRKSQDNNIFPIYLRFLHLC